MINLSWSTISPMFWHIQLTNNIKLIRNNIGSPPLISKFRRPVWVRGTTNTPTTPLACRKNRLNEATSLPWVATCDNWGQDPGGWNTRTSFRREIEWTRFYQSAGRVMPFNWSSLWLFSWIVLFLEKYCCFQIVKWRNR